MPAQDRIPQSDERFAKLVADLDEMLAGKYKTRLNLSDAQLASIALDHVTCDYVLACEEAADQFAAIAHAARNLMRDGPADPNAPALPVLSLPALPVAPVKLAPLGMEKRIRELVQWVLNQPGCDATVESDLGIALTAAGARPLTPPAPKVTTRPGYGLEVKVFLYGHDAQVVYIERAGDPEPVRVDKFTENVAVFTLAPRTAGVAGEEVSVSVQYMDHDQLVGDPSPAVTVMTRRR